MTTLRILIEHEDGMYVGQCLEHDLCVQGKSPDDVRRRMLIQLEQFVTRFGGLDGVGPAPQQFHDLWASGKEPPLRMKVKLDNHELDAEFLLAAA